MAGTKFQSSDAVPVRRHLAALLESEPFRQAERQKRFLTYLVEEELAGRGEQIGQYGIAAEVFDRDEKFDPAVDSVVRVEARRLRSKLTEFYAGLGASDIVFTLPKGRYRLILESESLSEPGEARMAEAKDLPVIAILPFDNLSGDPSETYFSDGITEDIITDLSKVSGLSVISRHSTFVYKGRSVAARDIGEDLGADYLVEGSVRRAGDQIRITAQLIDAATDSHVWAERYDRTLNDVFAIQDDVTRLIVGALNVSLADPERNGLRRRPTSFPDAYDLFLRAQEQFYQFREVSIFEAIKLFEEAGRLDPEFAEAQAWLGRARCYACVAGLAKDSDAVLTIAIDAARNSIAIDPSLPHGHGVLGWCLIWGGGIEEALAETRTAVEIDRNFADGQLWRAMALSSQGDGRQSLEVIERGIQMNPHFSVTYLHALGLAHFALGEYEATLLQCDRGVRRNPNFLPNHLLSAATRGLLGRAEETAGSLKIAKRLDPGGASIAPNFFNEPELDARYKQGLLQVGFRSQ